MAKKKKRGRPPKSKGLTIQSRETRIIFGVLTIALGVSLILSQFIDGSFFLFVKKPLGIGSIPGGLVFILLGTTILGYKSRINGFKIITGITVLTSVISAISHFIIPTTLSLSSAEQGNGGGYLGYYLSNFLISSFGRFIGIVLLVIATSIAIILITDTSWDQIKEGIKKAFSLLKKNKDIKVNSEKSVNETDATAENKYIGDGTSDAGEPKISGLDSTDSMQDTSSKTSTETHKKTDDSSEGNLETPSEEETIKYPNWVNPSTELLSVTKKVKSDPAKHQEKAEIIENTLKSFGIQAKVSEISVGPRVVQYALSITVGTKVSKVRALQNDLALALAAPSGSVRIEAPIPGTSLIGIEMPSEVSSMVSLRDVMESEEMKSRDRILPLVFGKDVSGKTIVKDLAKMPHILIAGATGSGKSVCVNAFLCGLIMTYSPDYLRLILVDPKMVELPPYNGIPHLLTPVITDVEKVAYSLEWLTTEMQQRFRILNKAGVRNIEDYNKSMGFPALPYIILVVDEMADIMLTAGLNVESKIVRLAQMARAVGIHLILATQRPSVDVLTGLIKANIPARIGMNVATSIDSRVILDMIGAENLLGYGDMLFKAPDVSRPYRIQGAFVSPEEVERVTSHLKSQVEDIDYNKEVTKPQGSGGATTGAGSASEDELFPDAVRIIVAAGKASSSLLQRKLRIGYNRAARLIDELYAAKVVSPADGSKPRDVLISDAEAFLSKLSGEESET
ncbi:DNA translocase FtsK 4TM domain-containing protein [Candidatus Dojkabacteria bacterium]|nr:DNA translocase FtsK 4TM domain-containing protein [Candidatus Dojkabacteria bacterium]